MAEIGANVRRKAGPHDFERIRPGIDQESFQDEPPGCATLLVACLMAANSGKQGA